LEALKQEKNQGIVVINHPNFHYALTAEDLAETDACFFEVYNAHPGSNNEGDSKHPDTEKMWDIASSLRLLKWKKPPLFGLATDDSHHYHEFAPNRANPGRAFVMVRARELTVPEIIAALQRGDFYASSGVILQEVRYEARERKLVVQVQPEKDTHYRIDFIGTTIDAEARPETVLAPESVPEEQSLQKAPGRFTGRYRPQIGHVFLSVKGTSATYTLTGKELYVRAVVTSDRPVPWLPPEEGIYQKAWTQPVGWPQANH
ncbi:MAG TPA: hypothetical protein PKX93_02635, partial [bacterium]|nr:hypothetical protein [bacterium]